MPRLRPRYTAAMPGWTKQMDPLDPAARPSVQTASKVPGSSALPRVSRKESGGRVAASAALLEMVLPGGSPDVLQVDGIWGEESRIERSFC